MKSIQVSDELHAKLISKGAKNMSSAIEILIVEGREDGIKMATSKDDPRYEILAEKDIVKTPQCPITEKDVRDIKDKIAALEQAVIELIVKVH